MVKELWCLVYQDYKDFKVFIVDDNSTDQTKTIDLEPFRRYFPVGIYHSQTSLNMVKARNKGIMMAGKDSDYFILLDDDNLFEQDFLSNIRDYIIKYPYLSVIQPKSYYQDQKTPCYFGFIYNYYTLIAKAIRNEEGFKGDVMEVDAVANCIVLKDKLISDIGYFDERYIIDFSEAEFCFRAKQRGYTVAVVDVVIYHQSMPDIKDFHIILNRIDKRPETYFYTFRNKYLFISDFGTILQKLFFYGFFQFVTLAGYAYYAMKAKRRKLFILYLKGFYAGNIYLFSRKLKKYEEM